VNLPLDLFTDYTLRNVTLGSLVLGLGSGALGSFALLRKQSLLGDAVSHAALPGIVIAFMLTGSKNQGTLLAGAAVAGFLGTLLILSIIRNSRIATDGAQGIVLSVFFGLGLMLLTFVQKQPHSSQAGLENFLFGQAATILRSDVILMASVEGAALVILALFWKEFKIMSFDPGFAGVLGLPRRFLDGLLTSLIVAAIVAGLSTVGVILMSAMLIAPAAAARQWTDRLGRMVLLASAFGALAGFSGSLLSASVARLPTGPVIVLVLTGITLFSILFSPRRGLVTRMISSAGRRASFAQDRLLRDLYTLAQSHGDAAYAHSLATIETMGSRSGAVRPALEALESRGLAARGARNHWSLTGKGGEYARALLETGRPPEEAS
jgi:manganese/zinc/iron transport system permease protein